MPAPADNLLQLEAEYKQTQASLKDVSDQVKGFAEKTDKELKAQGKIAEETKALADQALTKFNELQSNLRDVELELARGSRGDHQEAQASAGQMLVESDEFTSRMSSSARSSARVVVPRAAITTATGGAAVRPDRQAGIVTPPQTRLTVRDLLAQGRTESNSIEYVRETGFTNAAAPVAEGGQKPYSDLTMALATAPVRTIAALFKISRQMLDDAPAIRSYIEARGAYGLKLKEEAQLLTGNGTGQNIHGLVPQATAFDNALLAGMTGATAIDRMRYAILQAVLAEYPATGIVLHPTDWANVETLKDKQDRYLISNAQDTTNRRLWGLPVVETVSMPVNNFLVGAFTMGAQIFDRLDVEILISTENDKDFELNMATLRIEQRLALAVYRPEAFIAGLVKPA